jgi:hypothetical protein|nr:MAG TPA: hypothetical protein [Caudoviricetes sp.]
MNENAVKQRIRDILLLKESNPTKLSKDFSVNQKTLNNQINSDVQLSSSTILLILQAFPDVSAEWLLRGEGEMLKGNQPQQKETTSKICGEFEIDENGYLKLKI